MAQVWDWGRSPPPHPELPRASVRGPVGPRREHRAYRRPHRCADLCTETPRHGRPYRRPHGDAGTDVRARTSRFTSRSPSKYPPRDGPRGAPRGRLMRRTIPTWASRARSRRLPSICIAPQSATRRSSNEMQGVDPPHLIRSSRRPTPDAPRDAHAHGHPKKHLESGVLRDLYCRIVFKAESTRLAAPHPAPRPVDPSQDGRTCGGLQDVRTDVHTDVRDSGRASLENPS